MCGESAAHGRPQHDTLISTLAAGALVQWLKLSAWKVGDSSALQV